MKNLAKFINDTVAEKTKQGKREIVPHQLACNAMDMVENMEIKTERDILLFCASMNVLNTYVKQKNSRIGYYFKANINSLFSALQKNEIPGVKVGMDIEISKKGTPFAYVIVKIENVQFSFHNIKVSEEALDLFQNKEIVTEMQFDGLRKQICAVTIFEIVLDAYY